MYDFFSWGDSSLNKGAVHDADGSMIWLFATVIPRNDVGPTLSRSADDFLVMKLHMEAESKKLRCW